MSYTNGTPFLNLPQTIGSDHRDWFDTNESFLDLDTKVKTLWDDSGSAASAIDALQELTATLQTDLTSLEGTVDTHTSALSTINEALVLINSTLSTLDTAVKTKFDSAGIADPYDADHGVYSVGAVVTYNGQRYVCNTAVTAAEPFDADKWTAEDVQSVISSIKGTIVNLEKSNYEYVLDNTSATINANLVYAASQIGNYIDAKGWNTMSGGIEINASDGRIYGDYWCDKYATMGGVISAIAGTPTAYSFVVSGGVCTMTQLSN